MSFALLERALELDRSDPLSAKRAEFEIDDARIYLDGNSLGALPRAAAERLQKTVQEEWGKDLIGSWNEHAWIDLPITVGEKVARLIGAAAGQTVVCDSISVNLFKLLSFALSLRPDRTRILSERSNFPTDLYVAQGLQKLLGEGRCEVRTVEKEALENSLDESVAVLMLTHVDFRSGRIHDMAELTRRAHEVGAVVIWDLAHSAGALPVALDDCAVDLAVGCGYKYLNGGPGAPSFVYVASRHQQSAQQPLSGWMGHAAPFAFDPDYRDGEGILRFLCGTPPILSLSALDAALDVFQGVELRALRAKSIGLCEFFLEAVLSSEVLGDFELASPRNAEERGSQIALRHDDAYAICRALLENGVTPDFRAPDLVRFGFAPLYNRYVDVARAVHTLERITSSRLYLEPRFAERTKVT
ncbi:MAG: kynureninase [Acidobacteriota bacterium]